MRSPHFETRLTLNAAPARAPLKKLHLNKEALRTLTGSEKATQIFTFPPTCVAACLSRTL
jgi:hypothetical protein